MRRRPRLLSRRCGLQAAPSLARVRRRPRLLSGGAVSRPHHRSPRRHHWLRRRLARERFGTNRQHPATKKRTSNLRARNRNILPPFHPRTSLSVLSVFSQCLPHSAQHLTYLLFTPIYYLPANQQKPKPSCKLSPQL